MEEEAHKDFENDICPKCNKIVGKADVFYCQNDDETYNKDCSGLNVESSTMLTDD